MIYMKKSGNSNIEQCVLNLLKTFKSEIPYARNKGINHETMDLPADEIEQQMNEDAETVIDEYEPRVDIDEIEVDSYNENGEYKYTVDIVPTEDEEEEEW